MVSDKKTYNSAEFDESDLHIRAQLFKALLA